MTVTDWTAIAALVISSGVLLLEIRRWTESGVRLRLTVVSDAILIPGDDGFSKLSLWVVNYGSKPTTVTNFAIHAFKSPFHRLIRRAEFSAVLSKPAYSPIPARLDVGEQWHNQLHYDLQTWDYREHEKLFVGVFTTNRRRAYLTKVPKPKNKTPEFRP
jgi:hypothetical protein